MLVNFITLFHVKQTGKPVRQYSDSGLEGGTLPSAHYLHVNYLKFLQL